MAFESGSHPQAAAPPGSPQRGEAEKIESATTKCDPPPTLAANADDDAYRQESSPLSSPESRGEIEACKRDWKLCGSGEKIDDDEGAASGGAFPGSPGTEDITDKATAQLTTSAHSEVVKQSHKAVECEEEALHDQTSVVVRKGQGGLSGDSAEATAASEQQTKAREQAKRLALEVARLRSSLRATTSELNTERSARVRVEVRTNPHAQSSINNQQFVPQQHASPGSGWGWLQYRPRLH